MSDFRLRRAVPADAAALADLGARLFEQTFGAANSAADMRSYIARAFSVSALRADLADLTHAAWIAEDAEQTLIGYATLRHGTSADGVEAERPAEIQRIYADQEWHGRGLGRALMNACIEHSGVWGCDVLWLGVWEENPRAIAFYEKAGFRKVGSQMFVLGNDLQRDFVMACNLAAQARR
ncbi:MAG TPA: GNAT family N-acetyltransferase [Gemmatimonadaceae bacterium]|nr:GNAT family N-acetyltransferase [Gemmatimonadaceae bacterium]